MITVLTDDTIVPFIENEGLTIVDFWAGWCNPCRASEPILKRISEQYDHIPVGKIDVEANNAHEKFGVTALPTFLFFKSGKVVNKLVGFNSYPAFEKAINSVT